MYNTKIDISHIPFSRYGAYATIVATPIDEEHTAFNELTLIYAKRRGDLSPIYKVTVGINEKQEFSCTADPGSVTIKNDNGSAHTRRIVCLSNCSAQIFRRSSHCLPMFIAPRSSIHVSHKTAKTFFEEKRG